MLKSTSGEVEIFGRTWQKNTAALRQLVGLVMQETNLYKRFSVLETLQLFASFYQKPKPIAEVSRELSIENLYEKNIGDLSGGQKQLVHLASTLLGNPKLLLLDEPTVGLDIDMRAQFWGYIKKYMALGGTVFLTTHYFEEALELATHVSILKEGKTVASGPMTEVLQKVTRQGPPMAQLSIEKSKRGLWLKTLQAEGLKVKKQGNDLIWSAESATRELERVSRIAQKQDGFESIQIQKPDIQQAYEQLTRAT